MEDTGNEVKWWVRYVLVPLIGSGGIAAVIVALLSMYTDSNSTIGKSSKNSNNSTQNIKQESYIKSPTINSSGEGDVNINYGVSQDIVESWMNRLSNKNITLEDRNKKIHKLAKSYIDLQNSLESGAHTEMVSKEVSNIISDGDFDRAERMLFNDLGAKINKSDYKAALVRANDLINLQELNTDSTNKINYHSLKNRLEIIVYSDEHSTNASSSIHKLKNDVQDINNNINSNYSLFDFIQGNTTYNYILSRRNEILVIEFFSYGSSHCYRIKSLLEDWHKNKPAYVSLMRVPVPMNDINKETHAKYFYTVESLGLTDVLHTSLFDAIHKEKRTLNNEASLIDFAVEMGVDRETFIDAWNSFTVYANVRRAQQITERYKIDGVPTIGVKGRYETSAKFSVNYSEMLDEVDLLLDRETSYRTAQ
jgi:thiol:disulfide interchange protein DsbA